MEKAVFELGQRTGKPSVRGAAGAAGGGARGRSRSRGLGSNCAVFLVRSGIRRLVMADPDVVFLSNLNRQHFFPRHLGLPKVEALGQVLPELNPALDLTLVPQALDADSACALFAGCDVVVEAVDDPAIKKTLVEALLRQGHSVVSVLGMAGWGGPPMTARRVGTRLTVVGDFITEIGPGCPPMAPRVVMAAALEADAVLSLLLGTGPAVEEGPAR
ncbi:MAG: sulfur carrier protein ThiS adenylyltransferase ThiF [Bilophila sp.]